MPGFDLTKLFVNMINGKTGVVKLDAEDVHALPDDTPIPEPSDALPQDLGEATPGVSDEYARADHVHNMSGSSSEIASITFPAAWTDSGNGYYTSAPTIDGVTLSAESKIDLQITAAQFLTLQADGVENLYVENDNAALTAYSVGGYPSAAVTLQCTITGTQAPTPPVNPALDMIYPIGSIYMNVSNVNPGNLIGGTWERIEAEKAETIFGPLWSNPDPLAQFAAQTVTLEDNDAERFMFVIHERMGDPAQNNNVGPTFILKPGDVSVISTNVASFPGNYIYTRQVTSITQTTVTFGSGGYTGVGTISSSSGSRNDLCIPFEIYGIKKVPPFNGMYAWKRTA